MIEIIPAMDIIAGRCVRLEQGDFARETKYANDPMETAAQFEAAGLNRLHMVDLDGARSGKIRNLDVLERVARSTSLQIDFSGGVRTEDDVRSIFDAGASYVAVGSTAVKDREQMRRWFSRLPPEKFLLGADVRGTNLAVAGWQKQTAIDLFDHLRFYSDLGIDQVFVTDILRDGLMSGPAIDLYKHIIDEFPRLQLIASGGVRDMADTYALDSIGCTGVIIGKSIYEGSIKLEELAQYAG